MAALFYAAMKGADMTYNLIRQTPVNERPYERCERFGPEVLSDSELLAVLLRSGTDSKGVKDLASDVLRLCPDENIGHLMKLSAEDLKKIRGIGRVKAAELLCVCELSKRIWRQSHYRSRTKIRSSSEAAGYYMEELRYLDRERVYIMLLDAAQYLIGDVKMTEGTVDMSLVSVREIVKKALAMDASKLILIHNHPSGDPAASKKDMEAAQCLKRACDFMGIKMLDSIIIGDGEYLSFSEKGIL
ncbi:MAG: DNA repair protein RadC [Lachnospiraceae bacterium]|nr:DNA repair protein RadC [Lachnospiraceae bacterium]